MSHRLTGNAATPETINETGSVIQKSVLGRPAFMAPGIERASEAKASLAATAQPVRQWTVALREFRGLKSGSTDLKFVAPDHSLMEFPCRFGDHSKHLLVRHLGGFTGAASIDDGRHDRHCVGPVCCHCHS
jgi:hypothetical protein